MKISQSKVRVEPHKAMPIMHNSAKAGLRRKLAFKNRQPQAPLLHRKTPAPMKKAPKLGTPATKPTTEDFLSYSDNAIALQRILASARQELELIRRMKAETAKIPAENSHQSP